MVHDESDETGVCLFEGRTHSVEVGFGSTVWFRDELKKRRSTESGEQVCTTTLGRVVKGSEEVMNLVLGCSHACSAARRN